ncbi:MAG: hypothetical protein GXO32_06060, partial [Crenarchaeota archaeon]|nr:hypothetical protein [Thermoproteota archaeon]
NAALGSIATTIGERNSGNYITEITTVTAVAIATTTIAITARKRLRR